MSNKVDDILGKPDNHPSYGLIGVYRQTHGGIGGEATLFGSSIRHRHTISLRIKRAELRRNLCDDRYYGREQLIEVVMSPTQFAELITNMNCGDGVPCTLVRVGKEDMPEPVGASKREQFVAEFREHTDRVAAHCDSLLAECERLMSQPSTSKKERAALRDQVAMLRQEIASNLPFVTDQFNEQMDRTVHEAKGEIDAHALHVRMEFGRQGLAETSEVTTLEISDET